MGRSIKKPRECGAWVVVWRLDLHFIGSVLRRTLIPLPELCKGGFVHNHNAALPHGIGVLVEHDQDRAAFPCDFMVLIYRAHCRLYIADVVACRLSKPHLPSTKSALTCASPSFPNGSVSFYAQRASPKLSCTVHS